MIEKYINISYLKDSVLDSLYTNPSKAAECIRENPFDSKWLSKFVNDENYFELRKSKIKDFDLELSLTGNYKEVEYKNAIKMYENLKELPRYVLIDERFWCWLEFGKFYRWAVQSMPVKKDTAFEGRWIFKRGKKRGLWFNQLSRSYFWVEFTIDESLGENKYELTKFVFDKLDRIRHLTFDSKYRSVVFNAVKAEKKLFDNYANNADYTETFKRCESGETNIYTFLRKKLSLYGSVRILDFMDDSDLVDIAYEILENALLEVHKGNLDYIKN